MEYQGDYFQEKLMFLFIVHFCLGKYIFTCDIFLKLTSYSEILFIFALVKTTSVTILF